MDPIPYGKQNIDQNDIDAVISTLKSDYLTQGPKVNEFELKFAKYAYKKTFDRQNYFRVFDFLFFEKSRRELDQFIESQ